MSQESKNTSDELVSSICDELTSSDVNERYSRNRTLKSHIHNINLKITDYLSQQAELKSNEQLNVSWALGILSFVAICLLTNSTQSDPDFDWIRDNQLGLKLWGVALSAIYIGASIERSSFFKALWGFSATKIVVSVAFSGLVVYSTGKAAGVINSVFGVDASAFPISYTFTTAIIVFNVISPFLFFISLGAILHLFNAIEWARTKLKGRTYELPPYHSFVFPILASVIMYNGWAWSNDELSEKLLPEKVYMMAHALDFNSNHECSNLKSGIPVVFLGPSQNEVLADKYKIADIDFSTFFNARIDLPTQFFRMECNHPTYGGK